MIAIIAAVAENNVIGNKGQLPWYLPEDLRHFKELTTGHVAIMGRKTYESIINRLGKPLPNRTSVVITRQANYTVPDGVIKVPCLEEALGLYPGEDVFIIGGAEIYRVALPLADVLYVTHVHNTPEGDVLFPEIDWSHWHKVHDEARDGFSFAEYQRQ